MAEVKSAPELIHHCCQVNCNYMRLPAGDLESYRNLSSLYQSLADQSFHCSMAWLQDRPCPDHEPAVDAFWWAVVAWAEAFGISVGVDPVEWEREFVKPHYDFAKYLRPRHEPEPIEPHAGRPDEVIMELDVRWMKRVMGLTAKWGFFQHMKDMSALGEAQRLESELRADDGQVRDSYLRSDLKFFEALFEPFPFQESTRQQLKDWLALSDPGNKEWR